MKKIVCLSAMLLLLASCQHSVPQEVKTFSDEGPAYRLNVARVEVVDDYDPAPKQRTEYAFGRSLGKAMHQWADKRLVAVGTEKVLEVHITNASIRKKELPKQKAGVEGWFTKEQTEEYTGTLAVELKLYSPERTLPVAHAEVSAELTRTLREDASLEDRKVLNRSMTAEIMNEIDGALDRNIHGYFSNYLQ